MKIVIANDHTGVQMKNEIRFFLEEKGCILTDIGVDEGEKCDYPVISEKAAKTVAAGDADLGIIICGTGVGSSIVANKIKGIRAVVCSEPYSAQLSREHNNSNILALGARVVGIELAKMITNCWISAKFKGGRHQERVDMIASIECGIQTARSQTDFL